MLHVLQYQMKSYTDVLSQSQSYTVPTYTQTVPNTYKNDTCQEMIKTYNSRIPTVKHLKGTQNRIYPRVIPYKSWFTRNEIAGQEPDSHLTSPVDQVRPCRCRSPLTTTDSRVTATFWPVPMCVRHRRRHRRVRCTVKTPKTECRVPGSVWTRFRAEPQFFCRVTRAFLTDGNVPDSRRFRVRTV